MKSLSGVWLFATPWTVAYHAPSGESHGIPTNTRVGYHFLLQEIFPTQGSQNTYHIIMKFWKLNFENRENKVLPIRQKQFEWQWIAHQKSWRSEGSGKIFFKYWKKRTVKQAFYIDFWQVLTVKKMNNNNNNKKLNVG